MPPNTKKLKRNISKRANLYSGTLIRIFKAKPFWIAFIIGIIIPKPIIIIAKVYSALVKSVYESDKTENSDEKSHNSSIVAKGRLMPSIRKTSSAAMHIFIKGSIETDLIVKL